MFTQRRRRWPSVTLALVQCIKLSGVSGAGMESVTRKTMQQSQNTVQSSNAVSSVEDCGSTLEQHWVNVTCFAQSIQHTQ